MMAQQCSRPYSQLTVINVRHMHYLSQRKMPETLTRSKEMHKTLSVSKTIEIKGKLRNTFEIRTNLKNAHCTVCENDRLTKASNASHASYSKLKTRSRQKSLKSLTFAHNSVSVQTHTYISERRHRYRYNCLFFTKCHQAYTPYL